MRKINLILILALLIGCKQKTNQNQSTDENIRQQIGRYQIMSAETDYTSSTGKTIRSKDLYKIDTVTGITWKHLDSYRTNPNDSWLKIE